MAICANPLEVEAYDGNRGNGPNTSDEMAQRKGCCENGPNALEQIPLTTGFSGKMEASVRGLKAKWKKKKNTCILVMVSSIASSVITAFIFLGVILWKSSSGPCPAIVVFSCPSKWVGYEGKCYYFSETEGTWNSSQSNCSASDASLVTIEDQKEMNFIMQHKRATDYWIGLKRKKGQPWKWANGTVFNDWFEIGADGPCAYLNDEKASSTLCNTRRSWICSKSARVA